MFGFNKKKNNGIKITGTYSYVDVEIDNKLIRIPGEMGSGYFLCYEECITEWLKPEKHAITPEEKENLIERINQKQKKSKMKIIFRDNKKNNDSNIIIVEKKELSIEPRETDEKFFSFMKPIVNELVALLKKLNEMIEAQFEKDSENNSCDRGLFDEFCKNYREVIRPFCTEAFLKKWHRNSVSKPGDYSILNENAVIYFTMKSETKALVFIEPASEGAGRNCYKFELKNENGKYLIDKMFYYFKSENIFHRMHWL